jgi:prepilin-type N-terminal cleavage/methylation domain-containing protein
MRRGFTLVELLVSIALFGLIAVLLFGTIDELRKQQGFYKEKEGIVVRKNRIVSLLRTDFDRPQSLTVSNSSTKEFTAVSVNGANRSLYEIDRPYLLWLVLKNNNTLIRLESAYAITLPLAPESLYLVHSDVIGENCELFRVYDSPKRRLIYVKFANESPLIVETVK